MRFLFFLVSCLLSCFSSFGKSNSKAYEMNNGNVNQPLLILHKNIPITGKTHNAHGAHMAHASHSSHLSGHVSHTSHFSSISSNNTNVDAKSHLSPTSDNNTNVEVKGVREIKNVDTQKLKQIVTDGCGLSCKNIRIQNCYLKCFYSSRVEQKSYVITIDINQNIYKYYIYGKMKFFFLLRNGSSVYDTPQKISDIIWLEEIVKTLQK